MSDAGRADELQRRRLALGRQLFRRRRDRGKSQVVLAAALLCDRSTLSRAENHGAIPEDRRFWERVDTELAARGELLAGFDALIRFQDGVDDTPLPQAPPAEQAVDQAPRLTLVPETAPPPARVKRGLPGQDADLVARHETFTNRWGPTTPPDVWLAAAEEAAAGAVDMTTHLRSRRVSDEALDMYSRILARLSTQFVHRPATTWFGPLTQLWTQLRDALHAGPHPRQTQQLYLIGGMTGVVLAHGCHVVGSSDSGLVLARTAETLAKAIGHAELQAWALGTRALITEALDKRSPIDAPPLALVDEALSLVGSSPGTVVVRLWTYRARFAANAGAIDTAGTAQLDARRARDRIGDGQGDLDAVGGILTFGYAKQQALDAGILHACGRHVAAERAADEAITAYERGAAHERSRGDVAIAYLDRAAAQAASGRVDAAADSVRQVLDLSDDDMIAPLAPALKRVVRHLGTPPLRGGTALELRKEIVERGVFPALPAGTIRR